MWYSEGSFSFSYVSVLASQKHLLDSLDRPLVLRNFLCLLLLSLILSLLLHPLTSSHFGYMVSRAQCERRSYLQGRVQIQKDGATFLSWLMFSFLCLQIDGGLYYGFYWAKSKLGWFWLSNGV